MLIYLTTLGLSLALAISGSLTFWKVSHWYDFYIPIVLFIGGIIAMLVFWWIFIWICGLFVKKEQHHHQGKGSRFWLEQGHDFAFLVTRTKIIVKGENKIPTNQRFLLVSNHRSNFDSMAMTSKFKRHDLAFVTKQGNYKIPLFGRFLYGCCYYPLDRSNQLQSLQIFKDCVNLITSDACSVGVFPEGTRQRKEVIGDFHEGVFNVALKAKCPLVIVTESGCETVAHNFPFKGSKIYVDVLGVLPYEELEGMTAKAISDKVHSVMADHLEKIDILKHQRKYNKKK